MSTSPSKNQNPMVHVATAPNEAVAGMWKDILEQSGIQVLIKKNAFYPYITFNASCEIYVLTSKAGEAKQILESLNQGDDREKSPDKADE